MAHIYESSQLENIEIAHQENPRTYSIPRSDQRYTLLPGQIVKLVFLLDMPVEGEPKAERMWVEVKEVNGSHYVGVLDNDPKHITNLKAGDIIEFGPEHIAALYKTQQDLPLPYGQYALVSRELLQEDAWPNRLIHEQPTDNNSSGWRLLKGDETEAELNSQESFVAYKVDDLLRYFRVLDSVLDEPVGTEWRWNTKVMEYQKQNT